MENDFYIPFFDYGTPIFCLLVEKIHIKALLEDKKWSVITKKWSAEIISLNNSR